MSGIDKRCCHLLLQHGPCRPTFLTVLVSVRNKQFATTACYREWRCLAYAYARTFVATVIINDSCRVLGTAKQESDKCDSDA